jgi:hypothetical protein
VIIFSAKFVVTTNAAIGTDHNGATFWEKIRVSFAHGGSSDESEQVHQYVGESTP